MVHELETDQVTGEIPMFYHGSLPWHGLGRTIVEDRPATAAEAISLAGLSWTASKFPNYVKVDEQFIKVPDTYSVLRDDSVEAEGVDPIILTTGGKSVGAQYVPLQNVEAFSFFDAVVGEGKAIYHTAGALRQGDRIWILAKLPEDLVILGEDKIEPYILLTNSHDGTSSINVMLTTVRVVCANTLRMAMANGWNKVRIRHTATAQRRLSEAADLMGVVAAEVAQTKEVFEALAKTPMTSGMANQYFQKVYAAPEPDAHGIISKRSESIHDKRIDILSGIFERGSGADLVTTHGTLFGAFNAVTDYVDHYGRKSEPSVRMESVLVGHGDKIKHKALSTALNMVA